MTGSGSSGGTDRVAERRRAGGLAQHYRDFEGLSIRQIADRVGRSPATVRRTSMVHLMLTKDLRTARRLITLRPIAAVSYAGAVTFGL